MKYALLAMSEFSDGEYRRALAAMTPEKRERLAGLARESDRRLSAAGDLLARRLAAELCGCRCEELRLGAEPDGKPFVIDRAVYVSVSHAGDCAAAAAGERRVGVDVEPADRRLPRIPDGFFTGEERRLLEEDPARLPEIWTRKEAVLKCFGKRLACLDEAPALAERVTLVTERRGDFVISVCEEKPPVA